MNMKKLLNLIFGNDETPKTQKENLKYWHLAGVHDAPYGVCSDNYCPCPQDRIPRGEGYIYIVKDQNGNYSANLTCETGARNRNLNLKIAHEDAKYWWKTGLVPYRETPICKGYQEAPYKSIYTEKDQDEIRKKQRKDLNDYLEIVTRGTKPFSGIIL